MPRLVYESKIASWFQDLSSKNYGLFTVVFLSSIVFFWYWFIYLPSCYNLYAITTELELRLTACEYERTLQESQEQLQKKYNELALDMNGKQFFLLMSQAQMYVVDTLQACEGTLIHISLGIDDHCFKCIFAGTFETICAVLENLLNTNLKICSLNCSVEASDDDSDEVIFDLVVEML